VSATSTPSTSPSASRTGSLKKATSSKGSRFNIFGRKGREKSEPILPGQVGERVNGHAVLVSHQSAEEILGDLMKKRESAESPSGSRVSKTSPGPEPSVSISGPRDDGHVEQDRSKVSLKEIELLSKHLVQLCDDELRVVEEKICRAEALELKKNDKGMSKEMTEEMERGGKILNELRQFGKLLETHADSLLATDDLTKATASYEMRVRKKKHADILVAAQSFQLMFGEMGNAAGDFLTAKTPQQVEATGKALRVKLFNLKREVSSALRQVRPSVDLEIARECGVKRGFSKRVTGATGPLTLKEMERALKWVRQANQNIQLYERLSTEMFEKACVDCIGHLEYMADVAAESYNMLEDAGATPETLASVQRSNDLLRNAAEALCAASNGLLQFHALREGLLVFEEDEILLKAASQGQTVAEIVRDVMIKGPFAADAAAAGITPTSNENAASIVLGNAAGDGVASHGGPPMGSLTESPARVPPPT